MSKEKLRLSDFLQHVQDAIERVDRYTSPVIEADFLNNEMVSDAVIRNFEVIGEACHNIERDFPDFASAHPELPLKFAYEMRNAIAHGYYKVDLAQVWASIQTDLPILHKQVVELIHQSHLEIFAEATAEALKQFPGDIRQQNTSKRDIAESMGLTKLDIEKLTAQTKPKSHTPGRGR